jgi:hypothetical protein
MFKAMFWICIAGSSLLFIGSLILWSGMPLVIRCDVVFEEYILENFQDGCSIQSVNRLVRHSLSQPGISILKEITPPFCSVDEHGWTVYLPHSWFVALFAMLPATKTLMIIRHRRASGRGFCSVCGYDLRGSSSRCPECGKAI